MNEATFRFAHKTDAPILAEINLQSWQHAYKNILPGHVLRSMDLKKLEQGCLSIINHTDKKILVLEIESAVHGYTIYGEIEPLIPKEEFEIFQFYLDPRVIGKGSGAKLLQKTKENIEADGGEQIIVKVLEKNTRARKFFEKFGFAQIGPATKDSSAVPEAIVCYRFSPTVTW